MLPVELIEIIISYLNVNNFSKLEYYNRYLNFICNNENLCRRLCNNRYKDIIKPKSLTWKEQYKTFHIASP